MKYLQHLIIVLFLSAPCFTQAQIKCEQKDKEILKEIFEKLQNKRDKSVEELLVLTGKYFIETPYVAHTLESEKEQLVINLRELDCTTYAENCLAIARCIKSNNFTFEKFANELTQIRYRQGTVNGYTSRLHYFSDWIYTNHKKELIRHVSEEIAHTEYPNVVDFMSTHPDSYKPLKNNPKLISEIGKQEKQLSSQKTYFLPKEKLDNFEAQLKDGDIVGITTSIPGLDITHVGIIVKQNGKTHLMHASSKSEKVIISDNTLKEYLLSRKSATGIMVARPL